MDQNFLVDKISCKTFVNPSPAHYHLFAKAQFLAHWCCSLLYLQKYYLGKIDFFICGCGCFSNHELKNWSRHSSVYLCVYCYVLSFCDAIGAFPLIPLKNCSHIYFLTAHSIHCLAYAYTQLPALLSGLSKTARHICSGRGIW